MRGFKPSYFQPAPEELHADLERAKEANLRRYVERVRAGLPLFDEEKQNAKKPVSDLAGSDTGLPII
jgi:hypothetical protein